MSALPLYRVSAGVLTDAAGRVLITQRPPGKPMAGWWEFPGGKAAEGESGAAALARELAEELGIRLRGCHPLLQLRHDYPDRRIELEVFVVTEFEGTPASLEGQALAWVAPEQLHGQQLLPADRPIIAALTAASAAASA